MTHDNSDDVFHLVRLLGLGDEVAPEGVKVDQRASASWDNLLHTHWAAIFGELVGCGEGPFALRRGPLGDGILGEQVVDPVLALSPSGHEVNERGMLKASTYAELIARGGRRRGEQRPEFQYPSPHRFVGDIQSAFGEQILDVAISERETQIEPNGVPDDRGRELVADKPDRHPPSYPATGCALSCA